MTVFVIEHLEEDDQETKTIPEWVELEYRQMLSLAGKDSEVYFTNLSKASVDFLTRAFENVNDQGQAVGKGYTTGILELAQRKNIPLEKICLLDPKAEQPLSPSDGDDNRFSWFLFGGILGDDPPRDRTSELRAHGFPSRHLGPVQMTTDTALGVTKLIVLDKIPLDQIPYTDFPTIVFNARESVEMPFRYVADKQGKPILPPGMRELLHKDLNKSFEF